MIKDLYDLVVMALRLYAAAGGPPIDPVKLGADSGVEMKRIDAQQAKDEAAENEAAKRGG